MFCAHLMKIQKMAKNEDNFTVDLAKYESLWKRQSVFKLPYNLISFNPNAFKPNVISFGPYHHNEEHLKSMEAYKRRSFELFRQTTTKSLPDLLQSFGQIKEQLMDHYVQLDNKWTHRGGKSFLKLMITEGCFMLDILLTTPRNNSGYKDDDLVFGKTVKSNVTRKEIKRDMLLIGNQLPLLVLKKLIADNRVVLEKLKDKKDEDWKKVQGGDITEELIHKKIHELVLKFLESDKMHIQSHDDFKYEMHIQSNKDLCLHALDVLRENMIQRGTVTEKLVLNTEVNLTATIKSATALSYTGVTFERNPTSSIMDITFEKGVLTLPSIFIDNETELTFLNLMAFERFQASKSNKVSAYIDLMDSLIRAPNDVRLLRDKEIIIAKSREHSDPAILQLFHKLGNKVKNSIVNPDHSLDEVRKKLADYYERHSCRGKCIGMLVKSGSKFMETYCKNLLTITSLVAGIILLGLTITQTIYTIIPFYEKGH